MELNLYHLIESIQKEDNSVIKEIIAIFSSQLESYSKKLDGDDTYQDLLVFLFLLIKNLCLEKINTKTEQVLLAYISKSLRHEYIRLSRIRTALRSQETSTYTLPVQPPLDDNTAPTAINDLLGLLRPKEEAIVRLIYFYGFSVQEISLRQHVSRQAINKIKIRALRKLRQDILANEQLLSQGHHGCL